MLFYYMPNIVSGTLKVLNKYLLSEWMDVNYSIRVQRGLE